MAKLLVKSNWNDPIREPEAERMIRSWLRKNGWSVERKRQVGCDILATRNGAMRIIEVKGDQYNGPSSKKGPGPNVGAVCNHLKMGLGQLLAARCSYPKAGLSLAITEMYLEQMKDRDFRALASLGRTLLVVSQAGVREIRLDGEGGQPNHQKAPAPSGPGTSKGGQRRATRGVDGKRLQVIWFEGDEDRPQPDGVTRKEV